MLDEPTQRYRAGEELTDSFARARGVRRSRPIVLTLSARRDFAVLRHALPGGAR